MLSRDSMQNVTFGFLNIILLIPTIMLIPVKVLGFTTQHFKELARRL